jgi:hypothetical protein
MGYSSMYELTEFINFVGFMTSAKINKPFVISLPFSYLVMGNSLLPTQLTPIQPLDRSTGDM